MEGENQGPLNGAKNHGKWRAGGAEGKEGGAAKWKSGVWVLVIRIKAHTHPTPRTRPRINPTFF